MLPPAPTVGSVLHVSIVAEGRRLDVTLPAQVPVIELVPGLARSLNLLNPTLIHNGYDLHAADGTAVEPGRTLSEQNVQDGELLTLQYGGLVGDKRIYDDIVEAVTDAGSEHYRNWSVTDSTRTALAFSLVLLALSALLLLQPHAIATLNALIAISGACVLIATAAVLTRIGQPEAGHAFGLSAALFGGIGGYLLVPHTSLWGWPLLAAAGGCVIIGGFGLALTQQKPEIHLIPICFGAILGVTAFVTAVFDAAPVPVYAVAIAVAAVSSNGLPWLALSSTRITVISPHSDLEVFAPTPEVDAEKVTQRTAEGHRVLIAARIAFALAVLAGAPLVAASGMPGALLCTLAFLGMMFQSRQTFARIGVATLMAAGGTGLAVTGLTVIQTHPAAQPLVLTVLLLATILLVALTLLTPRARLRLARVTDLIEVIALALLLPLGAITAGLV